MKLNLARKFRSRNFNEVIGQDLAVRILKNTLFKGHFFPVYLFSGQRGCGKTSVARIFGAAIQCAALEDFQKNPRVAHIPCGTCDSCGAMRAGNHPDFIEIDAASHTGVDNIRSIIDAASLLPVLGRKKIYLIDESHMLSKAAFNAFLKILEEPPVTALFILATTDPEKIIETVKSRCFQILFQSVNPKQLTTHLQRVCIQEGIEGDEDGLRIIAEHSEGSVRDALNLLEQARFAADKVNYASAVQITGHIEAAIILDIFDALLNQGLETTSKLIHTMQLDAIQPQSFWHAMISCARMALFSAYGVHDESSKWAKIKAIIKDHSTETISYICTYLYEREQLFLKTQMPHSFLEIMLLDLAFQLTFKTKKSSPKNSQKSGLETKKSDKKDPEPSSSDQWNKFIHAIEKLDDPLISSIFKQGIYRGIQENGVISIAFGKNMGFFKELLESTTLVWMPTFESIFGSYRPVFLFSQENIEHIQNKTAVQPTILEKKTTTSSSSSIAKPSLASISGGFNKTKRATLTEKKIDTSASSEWPKVNLVLEYFPGTVTEIQGNDHE